MKKQIDMLTQILENNGISLPESSKKREGGSSSDEPKKNTHKKTNKGEMNKCSYCSKGNHTERSCMKKQIDMLTNLLEKNGISLPEISKKREGGSSSDDKERVHALVACS